MLGLPLPTLVGWSKAFWFQLLEERSVLGWGVELEAVQAPVTRDRMAYLEFPRPGVG